MGGLEKMWSEIKSLFKRKKPIPLPTSNVGEDYYFQCIEQNVIPCHTDYYFLIFSKNNFDTGLRDIEDKYLKSILFEGFHLNPCYTKYDWLEYNYRGSSIEDGCALLKRNGFTYLPKGSW